MFNEINEVREINELTGPRLMNVTYSMERVELSTLTWPDPIPALCAFFLTRWSHEDITVEELARYIVDNLYPATQEDIDKQYTRDLEALGEPRLSYAQHNLINEAMREALRQTAERMGKRHVPRSEARERGGVWWKAACKVAHRAEGITPHQYILVLDDHRTWTEIKKEWR